MTHARFVILFLPIIGAVSERHGKRYTGCRRARAPTPPASSQCNTGYWLAGARFLQVLNGLSLAC